MPTSNVSSLPAERGLSLVPGLPPSGRAAVRGGVAGNYVDQLNIFLPVTALGPALPLLAGQDAAASSVALVVMATLIGRPLGAMIFGRISDAVGRTSTTRVAIAGTAACTWLIALVPSHDVLGWGTMAAVIALRFLGGVFLAGEYTSAIPLAMEWSAPRRRGLVSGVIMSMAPCAQATIAFVTVGLLALLGPDAYAAWGWRLSFAAGGTASLIMLAYYTRRVADAPVVHRPLPAVVAADAGPGRQGLLTVVFGRYAGQFWQVFALMSGLWLLTNMTVIVLTGRLATDAGLGSGGAALAMGIASVAQAIAMAFAGHWSTRTGRRRLFVGWGLLAALGGPLVWWWITGSAHTALTAGLAAAVLQVITVAAYGPVGAYINERFPARVRATAYGTAYSLSIVVPALYPAYLPLLGSWLGHQGAPMALIALGGMLVAAGGALGPRLSAAEIDDELEAVAGRQEVPAGENLGRVASPSRRRPDQETL
ncbi:MFS transporter [Nigerium massiliense]|uniref:MFS transporter n=1 Tax=Nigerium massiliense TaxID=1522317 RepID=UPI0009079593|nr:MFS transporter [Nigerium massiliense]